MTATMIFVGNVIGFVMLMITAGFCVLVSKLIGHGGNGSVLELVLAMPVLMALDLTYRKHRASTLFGRAGGRLFFIPAWLFGAVLGVTGVVTWLGR